MQDMLPVAESTDPDDRTAGIVWARHRAAQFTTGDWATEAESAAALDAILADVQLWTVYREVPGVLIQPRPSQLEKTIRIDRILTPTPRLVAAGWNHGVIGIEIKRSNVKIGPVIAQAMDYSRTVWTIPHGGIRVWLDWVFIWPMMAQHETTGSILAQNRIGSASSSKWAPLYLQSGQLNVIRVDPDGSFTIGDTPNGRKVGSR